MWENYLTTLHPHQFTSQRLLRGLHLHFNEIEELPEGVFAPLANLGLDGNEFHSLSLSGNKIRRLSVSSFGQHPHLRFINFDNNQIYAIQRGLFSRFHPRPSHVIMTRNVCYPHFGNSYIFFEEENLDENSLLEECFSNYEEVSTTEELTTELITTEELITTSADLISTYSED
jgi:hypothetical protein